MVTVRPVIVHIISMPQFSNCPLEIEEAEAPAVVILRRTKRKPNLNYP